MYYQLSKLCAKMALVSRENAKTRQNHCSFEVAVIGGKQFSKKIFFIIAELHQISIFDNRKQIFLSFKNQEILQFKVTKKIFLESDGLTMGTPAGYSFPYDFFGKNILRKKTSAIGCTKIRTITPSS